MIYSAVLCLVAVNPMDQEFFPSPDMVCQALTVEEPEGTHLIEFGPADHQAKSRATSVTGASYSRCPRGRIKGAIAVSKPGESRPPFAAIVDNIDCPAMGASWIVGRRFLSHLSPLPYRRDAGTVRRLPIVI